jgi:hypothetical protein
MKELFSPEYGWVWAVALGGALFFPVRQFLWVMYVRRAERDGKQDGARRGALRRRATVTACLLCFVFASLYTLHLFAGAKG